jgi:hypothetical protein
MGNRLDIKIGDRFNRLTIVKELEPKMRSNKLRRNFLVKCDCGVMKDVVLIDLTTQNTKSCGCYEKERQIESNTKHSEASYRNNKLTTEYRTWVGMKVRCYNPNRKDYKNYGGRESKPIKVCDRWLNSFENFLEDMGRKPGPEYSIDRIDFNGNYEPSNCRWADKITQARNKRNVKHKSN